MIKVKINRDGFEVELDFDEAAQMEIGLVAVSKMIANFSHPIASVSPSLPQIASQQPTPPRMQSAVAAKDKPTVEEQKQERVQRMNRARLLNNDGGPSQTTCLLAALKEMNTPASPEEIYNYMVSHPHLKFTTTAARPLHGIKQALRQKVRLFTDIGDKRYVLNPEAGELLKKGKNVSHKSGGPQTEFKELAA